MSKKAEEIINKEQRYLDVPPPKYLPNKDFGNARPDIQYPPENQPLPKQFTPKQKYLDHRNLQQPLDYMERPEFIKMHPPLQSQNQQQPVQPIMQQNQYYQHPDAKYMAYDKLVKPFPPHYHQETHSRAHFQDLAQSQPQNLPSRAHDYIPYDMEQLQEKYPPVPGYQQLAANERVNQQFQQIKEDVRNRVPQGPRHQKNIEYTDQLEQKYQKKQQVYKDYMGQGGESQPFSTLRQNFIQRNQREYEPIDRMRQDYHNQTHFNVGNRQNYEILQQSQQPQPLQKQLQSQSQTNLNQIQQQQPLYVSQYLPQEPYYAMRQAVPERQVYNENIQQNSKYQYLGRKYDGQDRQYYPSQLYSYQTLPQQQQPIIQQNPAPVISQQPREYVNRVYYNDPRQNQDIQSINPQTVTPQQLIQQQQQEVPQKYNLTTYQHGLSQEQEQKEQVKQQLQQSQLPKKQSQSNKKSVSFLDEQELQSKLLNQSPRPQQQQIHQSQAVQMAQRNEPLDYVGHRSGVVNPYIQERLERQNQQLEYEQSTQSKLRTTMPRTELRPQSVPIQQQQQQVYSQQQLVSPRQQQQSQIGQSQKYQPYDLQYVQQLQQQPAQQEVNRFQGQKYYEDRPRTKYEGDFQPREFQQLGQQKKMDNNVFDMSDLQGPLKYF